jgi:predicted transposase YbfD/YdcC
VLAQRQVGGALEESPRSPTLLEPLDLAGVVVTADALHTHHDAAEFLVAGKQAHYLGHGQGQPADPAGALPASALAQRARGRPHPRPRSRPGRAAHPQGGLGEGFGFPHAAQVLQVTRKTRQLQTNRWRAVTVYAITSLPFQLARPARPADPLRGHWAIEALHHLRDTTFAEDASKVRTGSGPNVMASLRNLVIGVLCRAGPVNSAAALRRHARGPRRPLVTLGITHG